MVKKVYFADFETTQPDENNVVEVYLWCIVRGKYEESGRDIESFIELLKTMKKCVIYFHNLRFDFSYIQYYLIKNNIKYEILEKKGVIYQAKVFGVEFRDSLNFMPMTLKEVGENYCNIYKKTSIDYNVQRGHVATEEEIKYCFNDCRVLEEGLNNYLSSLEEVLLNAGAPHSMAMVRRKLTNAGIAFEAFKELSDFEKCCPKTTQHEYELYKGAYKGGYVYSNPCGVVENVQMIDCNSMYPYEYSTIDMPYGKGYICNSEAHFSEFKFGICKIFAKYELKKGFLPIIGGGVGKYGGTEYKASSEGEFEELTISSIDFNLIKDFYDIEYKIIWAVGFNTKPEFFKKYADIFIEVKNKEKGIKRAVAKVLLNSPYGKTAMNGINEIKSYKIDEEKQCVISEVTGYELEEESYQYLPIAIAITAAARSYLLKTAQSIGFENVLYMDTDSIKFRAKKVPFAFDPNILGAWKDEGLVSLFKTIAPKKYVYWGEQQEGQTSLKICFTCAGFSKKVLGEEMFHAKGVPKKLATQFISRFDTGLELTQLQSKLATGGRALVPVRKMIK